MTCEDCYHYDICGFEECDDDALTFCKDFKDKSRIIELPYKVLSTKSEAEAKLKELKK